MTRYLDLSEHINRMEQHIVHDELVRGIGFEDGKGCFVGCTVNAYSHGLCEQETGVPEWVWWVCDTLHENMSEDVDRGDMALRLLRGFQYCQDFNALRHDLSMFIQRRNIERAKSLDIDAGIKAQVTAAVEQVINCHAERLPDDHKDWREARSAAAAVAAAAEAEYDAIGKELLRLLEEHT